VSGFNLISIEIIEGLIVYLLEILAELLDYLFFILMIELLKTLEIT
jgi:hypothetical protein